MLGKQPGRRAIVVFSDGEDQGSHASITDVERRLQASDVTLLHDRTGPRRGSGRAQDRHAAAGGADRRTGAVHRQHRSAALRVRGSARRALEPVPARLRVDATPAGTTRSGRSPCRWTVNLTCGPGRVTARRHPNDEPARRGARGTPRRPRRRHARRAAGSSAAPDAAAARVPIGRRNAAARRHRRERPRRADPRPHRLGLHGAARRPAAPRAQRPVGAVGQRRDKRHRRAGAARRLRLERTIDGRPAHRARDRPAEHPVRRDAADARRRRSVHRSAVARPTASRSSGSAPAPSRRRSCPTTIS